MIEKYTNHLVDFLEWPGFFQLAVSLVAVICVLTFQSYGFTVDELHGYRRAVSIYDYYTKNVALKFGATNFYGAMPDLIALAIDNLFPSIKIYSRHLVSALFGILGIIYVYKLSRLLVDRLTASLALAFLTLNPMWFGYMFFNLKDIPYASLLVCAYYYSMKIISRDHSRHSYLKLFLFAGLLSVTKLIGIAMLAVFVAISTCTFIVASRQTQVELNRSLFSRLAALALTSLLAVVCFLPVFWPQIYLYEPGQAFIAVTKFLNYDLWTGDILIHGDKYPVEVEPYYYMSVYIAICLPLYMLSLILVSPLFVAFIKRNALVVSFITIVVFMLAYQALTGARVYNGYRHFLFLVPFLMIIAASSASCLLRHGRLVVRAATAAGLLACTVATAIEQIGLFPYQYVYYNALVGGTKGAEGRYYIDVWRSAVTESFRQLQALAESSGRQVTVYTCMSRVDFVLFPRLKLVGTAEQAEYLVSSARGCAADTERFRGTKIVYEVRRQGALLSSVHLNPSFVEGTAK